MIQEVPFAAVRAWMFDHALPLWTTVGIDAMRQGFVEKLDFTGRPLANALHRTRVAGRQLYVASHAVELGFTAAQEMSRFGAELLLRLYGGTEHGWPRTTTPQGAVLDPTPDLYDLAFVLFGLAWRHRIAREPEALAGAHRALDFIERRLGAARGYWHEWPAQGPRLQNPHMHLLEACLAAFEASGDQRFLDTARALVRLFQERLFDGRTLAEYFDADWNRADGALGRHVEPGHQLEWAWILVRYGRLAGESTAALAQSLTAFAEAHGLDAQGRVCQAVRDDGAPLDPSSRTWPNTERIKAHLALFEAAGRDPRAAVAQSARVLLDGYLATDVKGLWVDHFDAAGAPIADSVPASTLYHIHLAFAEMLRLEPAIRALP